MQAQGTWRGVLDGVKKGIPNHYHYDPDHYLRELDVFWYRRWIMACRAEQVSEPRDCLVVKVGNQKVVISRDLEGELHAFHNVCRHRGSILCTQEQGRFEGGSIVCPYHAWTYGLDGALIATPHQIESTDFDMSDYSLYDVAIGEWGGFVFVNLAGEDAEPLEEALGDGPTRFENYRIDELRIGHRVVLDIEANWKLLFENFSECFHCPSVHPELCHVVPIYGEGLLGEFQREAGRQLTDPDWTPTGGQSMWRKLDLAPGMVTFTMDGSTSRPFLRGLTQEEISTAYTTLVLRPNFFMNVHPDYIHTHKMLPKGPSTVQMTYEWLFEPSTMEREDFDAKQAYELWDITNRQDARNCEWQQEGLMSGVHPRNLFVPQENGPFRFNQWVLEELGEAD